MAVRPTESEFSQDWRSDLLLFEKLVSSKVLECRWLPLRRKYHYRNRIILIRAFRTDCLLIRLKCEYDSGINFHRNVMSGRLLELASLIIAFSEAISADDRVGVQAGSWR
jgi:hypothetical protein